MGSKRRYRIGRHPVYDNLFNRLRLESQLLNGGSQRAGLHTIFKDKEGLKSLRLSFAGNIDGVVFRNGEEKIATIPFVENKLKDVEQRFRRYRQKRVNEGFARPRTYPPELSDEKLTLEASLDVLVEELELVDKMLSEYAKREQLEYNSNILTSGPMGSGKCSGEMGGALSEIDGQNVSLIRRMLIIDEPGSPYHGMAVADYKEWIVKRWRKVKDILTTKQRNLFKDLAAQNIFDSTTRKEKWSELQKTLIQQHEDWKQLFEVRIKGKPSMPAYPSDCKKYL